MTRVMFSIVIAFALTGAFAPAAGAGGNIYGTVTTLNGETYSGFIRWDKNENYWSDVLDTAKRDRIEMPAASEGLNLNIFGWEIVRSGNSDGRTFIHPRFTIPFGHLAAIERGRGDDIKLRLKNGDTKIVAPGADVGSGMRGIVINPGENEVKLKWKEFARVDFTPGPDNQGDAQRLYGKVETSIGDFTGYVVWDKDEALISDILDGTDRYGDRRKIKFSQVTRIDNRGDSSEITLTNGDRVRLSGTNDVDGDNRGIDVFIRDLGTVKIGWRDFVSFGLVPAPPSPTYDNFDGGKPLSGTLTTRDGRVLKGNIVWDLDEEYSWEALDGEIEGIDFSVLFQYIKRIERQSRRGAKVILKDGLELVLKNSNDVDEENKGILVQTGEDEVMLVWDDLDEVVFNP